MWDNHYNTQDLTKVTFKSAQSAMDESRDAFTASIPVNNYSGTSTIDLKLTRPFAKLRVVTTDIENLTNLGIVPAKAAVLYSSKHYESFNAVEGKVNGTDSERDQIVSYTYDIKIVDDKNIYGENNKADEYTIFTDYFFANDETVQFTLDVKESNGTTIKSNTFNTQINVKRNYLTTIKGNILTDGKGFEVTIDDAFAGENGIEDGQTFANVDTAEELLEALENGTENITLDGDIDLNDLLNAGILSTRAGEKFGITIAAGKKLSLDLNGFTLSGESATAGDTMITNNGELNIVNGTVTYKYTGEPDSTYSKGNYAIVNSGKLNVNANINIVAGTVGDKFRHALYVIQNAGELVIDGGKILNNTNVAIRNWVGSETKPSNITINGGEIEGLRGIWNQLPNSKADFAPKANIVINGGTLTGTAIDGTMDSDNILAIYSYTYGNQAKNVNIEVNGGTINGDIALTGGTNKNYVEKLTINGGKFNGLWGDVYSYADDALAKDAITIKGGEFSSIAPLVYLNGAEEGFKLLKDIALTDETYTFTGEGTLDLNGKTLSVVNTISDKNEDGKYTSADNVVFIDVRGNLTVKNGTMTLKHTGENYGWNACTELFYVGFNGTLNVEKATIENLGGSDMAYCIDMVNATNITVNVNESTLKSTYIPFRVFNNDKGMNNVTIKNSTLEGVSRAFWVHIYSNVDNGGKGVKDYTLNLDIYGNGNTFIASNPNRIIEFGFTDEINFDAEGNVVVSTFAELEAAAKAGGNIALGADIEFTKNIAVTNSNFTLNGKGHKLTQAESFNNTIALIDITYGKIGLKNVKFDGIKTGAVLRTVYAELKADNVTVENCEHTVDQGLIRLLGSSEITNSTFKNNNCKMLISYNFDDSKPEFTLLLENNVIENNTCSKVGVVYYVDGGGATIKNNKFIGNTTNITTNGATLYMGFTENNVITGNLFQNNKLTTTSTAKRVGGALHIGYQCELTGNAFIGNTVSAPVSKGNDVCASVYYTDIDLSGNYWGGGAPVENDDYFVEYTNYKVIVNDYLTENPIK